jgi:hypothetical protein
MQVPELIYFRYQIWSCKNPHFVRNLKKKTKCPTFFTGVGISRRGKFVGHIASFKKSTIFLLFYT